MTDTTRIYRFHQYGAPEMLQLDSVPITQPGAGEVRVRVQAMGLNRADLLWLANTYVETPRLPSRIGYEIAGVVEEVGSDVTEFQVGERVSSIPAFSISDYANFGETAILPTRGLVHTPTNFSFAQGAAVYFQYFTGYFALAEIGRLLPYQSLLITAASSSTGMAAIAIAKKLGATIIATTRTSKKRDLLLNAGAHHVIATEEEDLAERVMAITQGQGVDVIYDCVFGALSEKLAQAVKIRGHWIVYGVLDTTPVPFPLWTAFIRSCHFYTYKVFDFTGNRNLGLPGDEVAFARAKQFIAGCLSDGSLPVLIDREFKGLESLPEAMRHMESNQAAGKIVVAV